MIREHKLYFHFFYFLWQEQLRAVHNDLGIVGVRFHGSFDDDMGPVVTGSVANPVYNFTALDTLYDSIMAAGMHPIVELSFMPQAIADCAPGKCRTQMHYRGIPGEHENMAEVSA